MIGATETSAKPRKTWRRWAALLLAPVLTVVAIGFAGSKSSADEAPVLPTPALDEPVSKAGNSEIAVLAGGCFWGVQGVFQHVKGVTQAVAGYAGGGKDTAQYETVSTGNTGHAESVRITFDPHQISYGHLLQIYFSVVQDPTELDYQGPDSGTQYRSAIFPTTDQQAQIAKAYIAQLDQAHIFKAAIVTSIEPGRSFFPAEDYHQNFLALNPTYQYIAINDLPKVDNLKRLFPDAYRADPVLVAVQGASN